MAALAGALALLGERPVTLARELTKHSSRSPPCPAPGWQRGWRPTRNACVVNSPWCCTRLQAAVQNADEHDRVLLTLLAELPLKQAGNRPPS
ncbi:MAG: hypothetical protein R3F09_17750 [Burkholderiaceae bacterium]